MEVLTNTATTLNTEYIYLFSRVARLIVKIRSLLVKLQDDIATSTKIPDVRTRVGPTLGRPLTDLQRLKEENTKSQNLYLETVCNLAERENRKIGTSTSGKVKVVTNLSNKLFPTAYRHLIIEIDNNEDFEKVGRKGKIVIGQVVCSIEACFAVL